MSVPEILCKNSSYKRKLAAEIAKLWYVTLGKYGTNKPDVAACSNWYYEYNKNSRLLLKRDNIAFHCNQWNHWNKVVSMIQWNNEKFAYSV